MNTITARLASSSQSVNFLRYAVRVWHGAGKHAPKLSRARVLICVSFMRKLGVGDLVGSFVQSPRKECLRTLDSDHMVNYIPSSFARQTSKGREYEQMLNLKSWL